MKVSRGFLLFLIISFSLAIMNCQWVKACLAPRSEFFNFAMWCWTASAAFVIYLPYVLFRKSWPSLLLIGLTYVLTLANLIYLRVFGSWIPLGVYGRFFNLADFTGSVTDCFEASDVIVPLLLVAGTIMLRKTDMTPCNRARIIVLTGLSFMLTMTAFASPEPLSRKLASLKKNHSQHALAVSRFSLPVVLINCSKETPVLNSSGKSEVSMALNRRLKVLNPTTPPANLVIVFMESLESWPIGMKIAGKEITPVINRIVADSTTLYVDKVKNQTGAGRSIDAQLLALCGLLPPSDIIYPFYYPGNNYPSIYKAMKQKNAAPVYSFTTDRREIYNIGTLSRQFGVDSLYVMRMGKTRRRMADVDFFKSAVSTIEKDGLWNASKPKCMQFVTYSCHAPFVIPKGVIPPMPRVRGMNERLEAYINAVHYSDSALGVLVDYLKTKPDYKQTMIVVMGDHPAFGQERRLEFSNQIHEIAEAYIPLLIINAPEDYCRAVGNRTVEQVDVYTTMIGFLGLQNYDWHGLGRVINGKSETIPFDRELVSELILAHNLYRNKTIEK